MPKLAVAVVVLVGLSCAGFRPARAEIFVDLYGGYSWTRPTDVRIKGIDILGVPVDVRLIGVEPESSPLAGVRLGYWFGFLPEVGVALDLFYFQPDVRAQRVRATAAFSGEILGEAITVSVAGDTRIPATSVPAGVISPDLMLRWRLLRTEDIPHGRLQPYLMGGPSFLITDPEDFDTAMGFNVGAGLAWQLHRRFALFTEYRFTRFQPEVRSGGLRYRADVSTHHVTAGLSLRF